MKKIEITYEEIEKEICSKINELIDKGSIKKDKIVFTCQLKNSILWHLQNKFFEE